MGQAKVYKSFVRQARALDKAILEVHHSGKSGDYLGSVSVAIDTLEMIKLTRAQAPEGEDAEVTRIDVSLEKGRDLAPGEQRKFTLEFESSKENGTTWTVLAPDVVSLRQRIVNHKAANPSQTNAAIAAELECSAAYVGRVLQGA